MKRQYPRNIPFFAGAVRFRWNRSPGRFVIDFLLICFVNRSHICRFEVHCGYQNLCYIHFLHGIWGSFGGVKHPNG